MPRRHLLLVAVLVVIGLVGPAGPVSARDGHRAPPNPTAPSTTVPGGIDAGHAGDHSAAVAPDNEVAVEPADPDQVNEVLRLSSAEARARRDAAQAELDELDERVARLAADIEVLEALAADLVVRQRVVARRAVAARRQLLARAVGAYVQGNAPEIEASFGAVDPNDVQERSTIVRTILEADQDEADRLLARRLTLTARLSRVLEQAARSEAELAAAEETRVRLEARLESADFALQVFDVGGDIVITGFVFPVADPHTFASTFGAPRSGGRSHQGNDIFAPMGTPLLASERGVIDNMGTGSLGGIKLWLVGESGTRYYYAHLSAYADGIRDGVTVEAGEIIGYVGNTGNAISTPPHLHYEIHPDGGGAIDPYPLLRAVDQIDGERPLPPRRTPRP